MECEIIEGELQEMYEEPKKGSKVLCSEAIKWPLHEMKLGPAVTVQSGMRAMEANRMMREKDIGCMMVLCDSNLVGAFTERDVLMRLVGMNDLDAIRVDDVMTRDPNYLQENDKMAFALNLLSVGGCCHVPVLDAAKQPIGVLSLRHIVEFMADCFPQEILNLPTEPMRTPSEREGA
jgi:CBS domain-containing protein